MKQESKKPIFLLKQLQLFGLEHLDAVVLASLADRRPLLLIGAHGTAKSEMVNRLAETLKLTHRHYNASLLSFDDLLGYPILNSETKQLEFVKTAASVWGAQSIFFDEISRCRPETANKLFAIIHESKLQGLSLSGLQYRWAAMNPPISEDNIADDQELYLGSLPLDPALADRFAWVVTVPTVDELTVQARRELIAHGGDTSYEFSGLSALVEETREKFKEIVSREKQWAVEWVEALLEALRDASFSFSGRRYIYLRDSLLWIRAASEVLGRPFSLEQSAFEALKNGVPQRAQGKSIDDSVLIGAHRAACNIVGTPADSALRAIRGERNPVKRITLALDAPETILDRVQLSEIVTDAFSSFPQAQRWMLSILLSRHHNLSHLNASTIEIVTNPLSKVLAFSSEKERKTSKIRSMATLWDSVLATISRLKKEKDPDYAIVSNMLMLIFSSLDYQFNPEMLLQRFQNWRGIVEPQTIERVEYAPAL